jgi:hypothetical protein
MEPREPRNKVLVRARMQCGARWQDVCILNYSARGLGLTCEEPPPRGTYLEIRRGPFVIVAKVAWCKGHRFGARTQDPVAHVAIVGKVAPGGRNGEVGDAVERRSAPRLMTPVRKESRERGRSIEFAGMAIAVLAGAVVVADSAYAQLSRPLEQVRSALSISNP